MTPIAAKNATTEPLSGGKTGSQRQSVMMQQQITHCPASFLHFTTPPPPPIPFFPPRYSAAPSQIPCRWPGHKANPAHPKHAATQYGGYKKDANTCRLDGSVCAPANWSRLILSLGVQLLVTRSCYRGREALMVSSMFVSLLPTVVSRRWERALQSSEKKE